MDDKSHNNISIGRQWQHGTIYDCWYQQIIASNLAPIILLLENFEPDEFLTFYHGNLHLTHPSIKSPLSSQKGYS